jgi:hypothetical protein
MTKSKAEKITGLKLVPGSWHRGITETWRVAEEFCGIAADRLELEYLQSTKEFRLWFGGHVIEHWPTVAPQDLPPAIDPDDFEQMLIDFGEATAPNGAVYRLLLHGPNQLPACERRHGGVTEIILGFNSNRSETLDDARQWAKADGRHEMSRGAPLSKRILLA